ncbi:unnamed protein product [Rhodiola kirilowii]
MLHPLPHSHVVLVPVAPLQFQSLSKSEGWKRAGFCRLYGF